MKCLPWLSVHKENKTSSWYVYNFAKGYYIGMCSHLLDIDFSYISSLDVELSWSAIKNATTKLETFNSRLTMTYYYYNVEKENCLTCIM